jgi:hypothetical protein
LEANPRAFEILKFGSRVNMTLIAAQRLTDV